MQSHREVSCEATLLKPEKASLKSLCDTFEDSGQCKANPEIDDCTVINGWFQLQSFSVL